MRTTSRALAAVAAVCAILVLSPAVSKLQGPDHLTVVADSAGAVDLTSWNDVINDGLADGALRRDSVREDTLIAGRTHERFTQQYRGVPIFGSTLVRQLADGRPVSIFGDVYRNITLDPTPALSVDEVVVILADLTGVTLGPGRAPTLVVLPLDEGAGYALTYRAEVATLDDVRVYFIDAHDGRVRLSYSNLQTQSVGRGQGVLGDTKKVSTELLGGTFLASDALRPPAIITFDMRGDIDRVTDFLNGIGTLDLSDVAADGDNDWIDGPTVDAHTYAGWVYDYYYKQFGRLGLDDANIPIRGLVHPVRRQDYQTAPPEIVGNYYLNAFYCCNGIMVYGVGWPPGVTIRGVFKSVNQFAAGLDIVAHELTHGVTAFSSGLVYRNESGALNEAFSDIMSVAVEFYFQPAGSGLMQADYLLGEDVFVPGGARSMANPTAFGQPDHYSQLYTGAEDNGGVHINSGIANHAFYLAIEGGTHRLSGLQVSGVGSANREQIERIFYRAFVFLMPSTATFSVARQATIQAARDLYGAGSAPEQVIIQAWTAVGVL